jgi:hypothetical protein
VPKDTRLPDLNLESSKLDNALFMPTIGKNEVRFTNPSTHPFTMLKTIPAHWFTWDCDVFENRIPIAKIGFSVWGEAGELDVQSFVQDGNQDGHSDGHYQVYRDSGSFLLADHQACIAIAEKPNPIFRQFFIKHADSRYELQAVSPTGRTFILQEYGQIVGSIYPARMLTHRAIADLPDAIPLPVRLFIIWLVLTLWKRQQPQ